MLLKQEIDSKASVETLLTQTNPLIKDFNLRKINLIEGIVTELFEKELNQNDSIFLKVNDRIIKKIAEYIAGSSNRYIGIGIAGETASGKSTVALDLIDIIKNFEQEYCLSSIVTRINTDDYYYDRSEMVKKAGSFAEFAKHYDLDRPEAFELELLNHHISMLTQGKSVYLPKYDMSGTAKRYDNHTLASPAKIVLSEGLYTLTDKVKDVFDIKIFVDVTSETQKNRWYERAAQRNLGSNADEVFKNAVDKAQIYIKPTADSADIILNGEADRQKYRNFIKKLLNVVTDFHFINK